MALLLSVLVTVQCLAKESIPHLLTRYLVKKLKELGYDLYSRDEFNTSQMFPELGERVIEAGNEKKVLS